MSSCCWCCCYCLAPPTIDWNRVRKIVSANNKFVTSRHTRWTWRWPCNPNNCSHTSSFFFVALQPTCKCRICISWAYAYASTTALVESSSNITRISKCIISSNPWWSINTHKTQKHKKQSLATKLHPPPKNRESVGMWVFYSHNCRSFNNLKLETTKFLNVCQFRVFQNLTLLWNNY